MAPVNGDNSKNHTLIKKQKQAKLRTKKIRTAGFYRLPGQSASTVLARRVATPGRHDCRAGVDKTVGEQAAMNYSTVTDLARLRG